MSQAQALKERVTQMIQREIARSRDAIGSEAWADLGEWVEDNVVESARIWLHATASEGRL